MDNKERIITFKATLVATFLFWGMMTFIFGLMLLPTVLDINIKYTEIIDINDDLIARIEVAEGEAIAARNYAFTLHNITNTRIDTAPKWYGD